MLKILSVITLLGMYYPGLCKDIVPGFTAVYDSRKQIVKIKWQSKTPGIKSFIIQRSSDNHTWADIALWQINNPFEDKAYYFEDEKPATGENYYRLKSFSTDDKIEYSSGVMIIIGSSSYAWVMYPVPVRDVLTLQYRGLEIIKGVITVLIQTSSGNIITRVRCSSLTRVIQIPVSNLGGGIYDLRIIVEDEIIWNQRFVK
jgi:hypothetical protein